MQRRRTSLREAIIMSDSGEDRSFNDIYGEDGFPGEMECEGGECDVPQITPEQVVQLRDLATQILAIVGPAPEDENSEQLAGDDEIPVDDDDGYEDDNGALKESAIRARARRGYYLN